MDSAPPPGGLGPRPGPAAPRRGPLVAEVVVLFLLAVADGVPFVGGTSSHGGLAATVYLAVGPGFGPAAAALAVLRRRFVTRIGVLGAGVIGLSLLSTASAALVPDSVPVTPGLTETFAIALFVGAGCRRSGRYAATGWAVVGGVAMTAAPVLRYGVGSSLALLAVPAALLWGGSLAVGLILRDADDRRLAALAEARTAERLRLARELHDFVAHHVTGIVVRAQAARVLAEHADADGPHTEVYREIEEAGSGALTAMRRLVGMLRADVPEPSPSAAGVRAAVLDAAARHDGVTVDLSDDLDRLPPAPALAGTVHRVVLEALTNVRRHAPDATDVRVTGRVRHGPAADVLVVEVVNDGVRAPAGDGGYGLVGMAERVAALGGTLRAGAESGRRWRITVRLPVDDGIASAGVS